MNLKNTLALFLCLFLGLTLGLSGNVLAQDKSKAPKKTVQQATKAGEPVKAEPVEEAFKKTFPMVDFDAIKQTDIKGVFEIRRGTEIIYFLPEPGVVFVGNIIDKQGKSLTEQRKGEIIVEGARNLPLEKAIKVGDGKNTILEFTDPDCPYCRTASTFLDQRKDVTRYIFFVPLPMHPDAENKIRFIFCSEDRAKTYEEAMKGTFDDQKYEKCTKQEAADLLAIHKEIGKKMGVNGTPFFIINGKKSVTGANTREIEAALNN